MSLLKRKRPGFYVVGDFHIIEKNEGHGWKVLRFPTKESSQPEHIYKFDYYTQARDHAIMEASIKLLVGDCDE